MEDPIRNMTRLLLCTAAVVGLSLAGCRQSESIAQSPTAPAPTASTDITPPAATPAAPRATASLTTVRTNEIVDSLFRTAYPAGFDKGHGCWRAKYGEGGEAMDYCMRSLPAASVVEDGVRVIYVAAASASDIEEDATYRYGATDPGMFDAFRIAVAPDGTSRLTASTKGMDFGGAGDCGCAAADFVALGEDVHGWVFTSGVVNQGATSSVYSLVAPIGAEFKDVGGIAQYVEDDPDIEYRLAIADGRAGEWYPLTVSKFEKGARIDSRTATFDAQQKRYSLPQSF